MTLNPRRHNPDTLRRVIFFSVLFFLGLCSRARAEDCKLRGYDGKNILKLDCQTADEFAAEPSPLRVTIPDGSANGALRGIKLVDPGSPRASKFMVRYKKADGGFETKAIGGYTSIDIATCEDLQMIGYHPAFPLSGIYTLTRNIDCSATNFQSPSHANSLWDLGYGAFYDHKGYDRIADSGDEVLDDFASTPAELKSLGFKPIGIFKTVTDPITSKQITIEKPFVGKLDGRGYSITNLNINRNDTWVGLFRNASEATFQDLSLINPKVVVSLAMCTPSRRMGSLVGQCFKSAFSNCYVTQGNNSTDRWNVRGCTTGGLVGGAEESTFFDCYAAGRFLSSVSGTGAAGGLVGIAEKSSFENCGSSVGVTSNGLSASGGGLVGVASNGTTVSQCYATGTVNAHFRFGGGLVGNLLDSLLEKSYATGRVQVSGGDFTSTQFSGSKYADEGIVGGLVGRAKRSTLKDCYATGVAQSYFSSDSRAEGAAGLVGMAEDGSIENCYSAGSVFSRGRSAKITTYFPLGFGTGSSGLGGGLVGDNSSRIARCFATGVASNLDKNPLFVGGLIGNQAGTLAPSPFSGNYWFNLENGNAIGRIGDSATGTGPANVSSGIVMASSQSDFYSTGSGTGGSVYTGWDFENVWKSRAGKFPCLQWQNTDKSNSNNC